MYRSALPGQSMSPVSITLIALDLNALVFKVLTTRSDCASADNVVVTPVVVIDTAVPLICAMLMGVCSSSMAGMQSLFGTHLPCQTRL